jgi:hypothetical protein
MPQTNAELASLGVAAINETYRTGDLAPWRRQGKLIHWMIFGDREQALEAAGPSK